MNLTSYLESGEVLIPNILLDYYPLIDVSDGEFLLWVQLYRAQKSGEKTPDFAQVAHKMKRDIQVIHTWLNDLYQKGLIALNTEEESLDLTPFIEKIEEAYLSIQTPAEKPTKTTLVDLKNAFEDSFARLLNPMELEELQQWIEVDNYQAEVILLALKEAVLNNVRNFRYVERILSNWYAKNLTDKKAVMEEQKRRKLLQRQKEAEKEFGGM